MSSKVESLTYSQTKDQKIYDAVHGFIRFNRLERALIHSEPFQRLHGLHQLGITYFVYPGAKHTRFEHSLGTMELATCIFERITAKGFVIEDPDYWLQVIRLAALCHDLGHLPFSHDAEHLILDEAGHEKWTLKIIESEMLQSVFQPFKELFPERDVTSDLIKMAIGEKKLLQMGVEISFSSLEKVLSQIITADFFGADRMDYLLRDAQCTGVSYGLFDYHQLMEMLVVLEDSQLGIEEDGIAACEALLLARHFMHQRVYQYSTVKAYKFHLARFLQVFYQKGNYLNDLESYLSISDHEIICQLRVAAKDVSHWGHSDAKALLKRERRFRAIATPEQIEESMMAAWGIPSDAYHLEHNTSKNTSSILPFPVLMRSQAIVLASTLSQISVPNNRTSWIYITPAWEEQLHDHLGRMGS